MILAKKKVFVDQVQAKESKLKYKRWKSYSLNPLEPKQIRKMNTKGDKLYLGKFVSNVTPRKERTEKNICI